MARHISIKVETWPLKRRFSIARGSKMDAEVICVEIEEDGVRGRGEAVPYARFGETIETASAAIEALMPSLQAGMSRDDLSQALLPGAARNALDCALWDLQAKQSGQSAFALAGLETLKPLTTAFTLGLDDADRMAIMAVKAQNYPLLKVKLGGADGVMADLTRLAAVAEARPDAQLVVDANEGWQVGELARYAEALGRYGVLFFEQPVPQSQEGELSKIDLPFCADESVHDGEDIGAMSDAYTWVNIKLDKAGGLTEALACVEMARARRKKIMVGCMVATSLSMAPAFILAQHADLVDLDGPLWLAQDREPGLVFDGASLHPPSPELWG